MYWSIILNFLLIGAVIIDRIYRLKSIKEFREAKEAVIVAKDATIESLKMQLEASEKNNDIEITEMHKKRVESIKIIVDEYAKTIDDQKAELAKLKKTKPDAESKTLWELIQVMLESDIQRNEVVHNLYNLNSDFLLESSFSPPRILGSFKIPDSPDSLSNYSKEFKDVLIQKKGAK